MPGLQVLCAVQEEVITDWKRLLARYSKSSAPHFVYGSDSTNFGAYVEHAETLWVVQLRQAEHPVLVARLEIKGTHEKGQPIKFEDAGLARLVQRFHTVNRGKDRRGWRYVAVGARDTSHFFPFNDVTQAVLKALFRLRTALNRESRADVSGEVPRKWKRRYGGQLHGPLLLKVIPDRSNLFVRLQRRIEGREVFVSYKHEDERLARPLVQALCKKRMPIWFDRLSLPEAAATARLEAEDRTLTWTLDQGLRASAWVVAVATERYTSPSKSRRVLEDGKEPVRSWTGHEWELAKKRIMYVPQGEPRPEGDWATDQDKWPYRLVEGLDASAAAKAIAGIVGS